MARHQANLGTLTITNGQQFSTALTSLQRGRSGLGMAAGLIIHGPAALTNVVTVQVLGSDGTWRALQSGGADVTIAATKTLIISPPVFGDLRLASAAAEGGQRDFLIDAQIEGSE